MIDLDFYGLLNTEITQKIYCITFREYESFEEVSSAKINLVILKDEIEQGQLQVTPEELEVLTNALREMDELEMNFQQSL